MSILTTAPWLVMDGISEMTLQPSFANSLMLLVSISANSFGDHPLLPLDHQETLQSFYIRET